MLTEEWTNAKILVAGYIQFGELLWWSWNALFQLCGFICLLQMLCLKSLKNLPFFGTLSVLASSSSSCVVMCSVSPELNVSVLQANTKYWDYSRMWTCLKDPLGNANTKCHCFMFEDNITILNMQYPYEAKNDASWSILFSLWHSWPWFLTVNRPTIQILLFLVLLKAVVSMGLIPSMRIF